MSRGMSGYEAQRLRRFRAEACERQGGKCYYCQCAMTFDDDPPKPTTCTAEHLKPRADGGPTTRRNIVAACARCNHARPSDAGIAHNEFQQNHPMYRQRPRNTHMAHALMDALGVDNVRAMLSQASEAKRSR